MAVHPRLDLEYTEIRAELSALSPKIDLSAIEEPSDLTRADSNSVTSAEDFDTVQFDITQFS